MSRRERQRQRFDHALDGNRCEPVRPFHELGGAAREARQGCLVAGNERRAEELDQVSLGLKLAGCGGESSGGCLDPLRVVPGS